MSEGPPFPGLPSCEIASSPQKRQLVRQPSPLSSSRVVLCSFEMPAPPQSIKATASLAPVGRTTVSWHSCSQAKSSIQGTISHRNVGVKTLSLIASCSLHVSTCEKWSTGKYYTIPAFDRIPSHHMDISIRQYILTQLRWGWMVFWAAQLRAASHYGQRSRGRWFLPMRLQEIKNLVSRFVTLKVKV